MSQITLMQRKPLSFQPLWRWQSNMDDFNKALQIVFSFLPYKDLCKCAIVSKPWRKVASDEFQSRCTINVKNDTHTQFVLRKLETCSSFRVGRCIIALEFVDSGLIEKILLKLHRTLNILILETSTHSEEICLLKILALLPNLTQLSIATPFSTSEANQNDGKSYSNWTTPFSCKDGKSAQKICNGEYCKVNDFHSTDKSAFVHYGIRHLHLDTGLNGRFKLSKIFHAFPKVVELNISNIVEESRRNLQRILQLQPKTLKHLTLRQYSNIGFPEKLVQMLMKLDICLEKLILIFHPPTQQSSSSKSHQITSTLLNQFIESQGTSLKSLKLIQVEDNVCSNNFHCYWNKNKAISVSTNVKSQDLGPVIDTQTASNYHWNFNYSSPSVSLFPMSLPNLETLHLQKPLITNFAQVLNFFPSLKQLSIQVSRGSNWKGMMPQKLEPHLTVTTFKVDFIDLDSFSRLGQCFPSLQLLQLGYCDESLFNILCMQIPYFNGEAATKNLITCQECHGCDGQKFSVYTTRQGKHKHKQQENSRTVDAALNKDDGESFRMEDPCPAAFNVHVAPFKNLKQLRVRVCHHFPYENFVFLQRGNQITAQSSTASTDVGGVMMIGDISDRDEFDSSIGYSWNPVDIMKEKQFVDLPLNCAESAESCSSA